MGRVLVSVVAMLSMIQLSTADIATGIVSTFAGVQSTSGSFSGDGGMKTLATFKSPNGIWVNTLSQTYIADKSNYRIRKVDASGAVSTIFGTGSSSVSGNLGPASSASGTPYLICGDSTGNVYFTDSSNGVARKIDSAGIVTSFAGGGTLGSTTSAADEGQAATSAAFSGLYACQVDTQGAVYLSITNYNKVKKVNAVTGIINTIAGTGSQASPDTSANNGNGGKATSARLNLPTGMWLDSANNLYVTTYSSGSVRAIALATNIITLVAGGSGSSGFSGDGGSATSAKLNSAYSNLAGDTAGNVYHSSASFNRIRVINPSADTISTLVGTAGSSGYAGDGSPVDSTNTLVRSPQAMVVYSGGLLVVDSGNSVIRLIGDWTPAASASAAPSVVPSAVPSVLPTIVPTAAPTAQPSIGPSMVPTLAPTAVPTVLPSAAPTRAPTTLPTAGPTMVPTTAPSVGPTALPSAPPSVAPSRTPSLAPTVVPTTAPTTAAPTLVPIPSIAPTMAPTQLPTVTPTTIPTELPTVLPTAGPTLAPSVLPTAGPTAAPTAIPTLVPSQNPSAAPTTLAPTAGPSAAPTLEAVTISFESHIYLHNASATSLDSSCQTAVVEAVALILQLTPSQVTYLSQEFIGAERRRLTASQNRYQVMVAVLVQATTTDFADTASRNASYLYSKLSTTLSTAVDSAAFSGTVRDTSATHNAVATRYVGTVNLTMTAYSVVDGADSDSEHRYSGPLVRVGGVTGVAMIVLFSILLLAASCYFYFTYRIYNNRKAKVFIAPAETECVSPA